MTVFELMKTTLSSFFAGKTVTKTQITAQKKIRVGQ